MEHSVPKSFYYVKLLQNLKIRNNNIYYYYVYIVKGSDKCDFSEKYAVCTFKESPKVSICLR